MFELRVIVFGIGLGVSLVLACVSIGVHDWARLELKGEEVDGNPGTLSYNLGLWKVCVVASSPRYGRLERCESLDSSEKACFGLESEDDCDSDWHKLNSTRVFVIFVLIFLFAAVIVSFLPRFISKRITISLLGFVSLFGILSVGLFSSYYNDITDRKWVGLNIYDFTVEEASRSYGPIFFLFVASFLLGSVCIIFLHRFLMSSFHVVAQSDLLGAGQNDVIHHQERQHLLNPQPV